MLPLLYGERFVGRIEPKKENGTMTVANIWLEKDIRRSKRILQAVSRRMKGFARFNDCRFTEGDN